MRGFIILSRFILVYVLASAPAAASALSLDDSRHLLSRAGFGASPAEIADLTGLSREEAVDRLLTTIVTEPHIPMPSWVDRWRYPYRQIDALGETQADLFFQMRYAEMEAFRAWWLAEMIATPSPLTEKMVLFWHDHFATSFDKSENNQWMAEQNQTFRRFATGNFRDLAAAMIRDPALLYYLDNQENVAEAPNENLAREWFELFTLGEGRGYSEDDIKEAARSLTGHAIADEANLDFRFIPERHDDGRKAIFGRSGRFDGDDLVMLALEHPAFGPYIVEKLWLTFVSDRVDPAEIERLAAAWRRGDFELRPLLRTLFLTEAFWAPDNRGRLIKSPVDLVVGTIRTLGLSVEDPALLPTIVREMGQDLFNPPNVAGWDGGTAWITDATAAARARSLVTMLSWRSGRKPDGALVAVRVAAEDFDGPTQFRVLINGRSMGVFTVPNGHDTLALGPIEDPFEDLTFSTIYVPAPANRVRHVEVRFEDDRYEAFADGRIGDRNLYVSWVEAHGLRMMADLADADGECIDDDWKIGLWCEGSLHFEVEAFVGHLARGTGASGTGGQRGSGYGRDLTKAARVGRDDLRVGLVAFQGAGRWAEEGESGLWSEFDLYDVGFDGRQWRNIGVMVGSWTDGDDTAGIIGFRRSACYPDCFQQWPGDGDEEEIFLSAWDEEFLESFTPTDRALVETIVARLPDLIGLTRQQPGWRDWVEDEVPYRQIAGAGDRLAAEFRQTFGRRPGAVVEAVSMDNSLGVPAWFDDAVSEEEAERMMMMMVGVVGGELAHAIALARPALSDDDAWFGNLPGGARDSKTVEAVLMAVPGDTTGRRMERVVGDPSALIRRLVLDPRFQVY